MHVHAESSRALGSFAAPRIRPVQRILWVFIPLLMIGLLEVVVRRPYLSRRWYPGAAQVAETKQIDAVLIGSSRVAAAVDPKYLADRLAKETGRKMTVLSTARGGTTLVQHTLGLGKLFARYPERMKGCTVLLELPDGLPPVFGTWRDTLRGWDGVWAWEDRSPQLLIHVLQARDLPAFWMSSTDWELKLEMTLRFFGRASYLVAYRESLRESIFERGRRIVREQFVARCWPAAISESRVEIDLAARGGIRRDPRLIEAAKAKYRRIAREMAVDQHPWRNWDATALPELIEVVRTHGAKLVLFRMVQSSVLAAPLETDVRVADQADFRRWLAKRGLTVIEPEFTATDADFPDLLHLAKSSSGAFTDALVRGWLADEDRRRWLHSE